MSIAIEQSFELIDAAMWLPTGTAPVSVHGLASYVYGGGDGALLFIVLGILGVWMLFQIFRRPKSIFISYRREDTAHVTGHIYEKLSARFGKKVVFKDVDNIPPGVDFREHLRKRLKHCSVLLAVIGKNWNPLTDSGQRRLSDPNDHLGIEIETALKRKIPVIPVLVDGVKMPAAHELPQALAGLVYYNGVMVRPDPDFHHDMDRLSRAIKKLF